jgi:hypothetical protein
MYVQHIDLGTFFPFCLSVWKKRKFVENPYLANNIPFVEIKCHLDATDKFLLQILLLAQHVSGTIMPIIRSSRVLYK